jgi:autotransporter-associated beta strand protein
MKKLILFTSVLSVLATVVQAQNETVTWQTPTNISGDSDVITQGTFYGSWAPYDGNANTLPVNGVVFQGYSTPPGFTVSGNDSGYSGFTDPNTTNANYNTLLETATYASSGSGVITITWNDTPGHTYLIEAWANDGRGNGRSETFTGGVNTSANVLFGNTPGQFITGTYVADSSGSETITLSGVNSANGDYPQINLLQIRDITVTPVTNYQSAVLSANPLAYYALNPGADPSGTSPDLTGNGNNGAANALTPAAGPSPYLTNAANFNGSSSFDDLSEGSNPGLLNFSGPITLEAWVQPASSTEFADLVAKGYDSSSGEEIVVRLNGPYGANYYGSSGSVGDTGGAQLTNWTYVVLSSDGSNCTLYLNGGIVAQNTDRNGAVNFTDDWVIGDGSSAGNSRLFNGNISEVAIYNYGLSAAQIQSHYYYGMAGTNNLNYAAPIITNQPQAESTYPGSSATFTVGVLSVLPTTYQWYSNNVAIAGQTNATLTLTNVQTASVANYSVVVGNSNGTSTSTAAPLVLLPAGVLEWTSTNNTGVWDTGTSPNWLDLANNEQTVFTTGNQVLFDDTPGVPTTVTVSGSVAPGILTVNSSTNNFTISSGTITGSATLIKEGSSTLTIDSAGNFTGPVTISGGAISAGNNSLDSVSSVTITNNSTLDLAGGSFSGNKPILVSGFGLNGEGAIYNSYADYPGESVSITLAGDTEFGGSARWDLASGSIITGPHNLTLDWSAGATYSQWNSSTIGSNVPNIFITNSTSLFETNGCQLGMSGMDTSCQNPGTLFTVSSNCQMIFYGGGFNGSIHVLGGGIVYIYTAPDAFNGSNLIFENNAAWMSYYNTNANTPVNSAVTLNGIAHFVVGDHLMVYTNTITGPGGFVLDYYNNGVVLSATETYQGPTIIGSSGNTPEVFLTNNGSISDSSLIFFGGTNSSLAHLDVTGRSDQTLTLASGQTLAGIGLINGNLVVSSGATISPAGSNTTIGITTGTNSTGAISASSAVTLSGTTVIKLNGSGVNDQVQAGTTITYGGTLNLVNISGSPLAAGNSFQIFTAANYAGSFVSLNPATPGNGLSWNTNQLSTGLLTVAGGPLQPTLTSVSVSSGDLIFGGTNGTPGDTYYVLTTTNLLTPLTNWTVLTTNAINSNGSFSATNAISTGTTQQYYRIEQQ